MNAEIEKCIDHAFFISPIVDMQDLIGKMMSWENVTEEELREKKVVQTAFGEDLSWEYLCYVREHPVRWRVPTDILYGSRDDMTTIEGISAFAVEHDASLTVIDGAEHWFHTDEQVDALKRWLKSKSLDYGLVFA